MVPRHPEPKPAAAPRRERRRSRAGARRGSAQRAHCRRSTSSASAGRRPTGSDADEHRSRRARGVHRDGRARTRAKGRQPPVLRPARAAPAGRPPRARSPAERTAQAQAAVAVPRPRPARRRRRDVRRSRHCEAGRRAPGRTALREELVERGELVPVEVEGVRGKRLVLSEDVELLAAPPEPPPSVAFLPPFDPLIWDRPLLASLFDFDYVWELFLPPARAPMGLVRAADLLPRPVRRPDRAADRPGRRDACRCSTSGGRHGFDAAPREGFVDAMHDALRAYLASAGASRLDWAPHLGAEKRLYDVVDANLGRDRCAQRLHRVDVDAREGRERLDRVAQDLRARCARGSPASPAGATRPPPGRARRRR